jgi:hypothetical protein
MTFFSAISQHLFKNKKHNFLKSMSLPIEFQATIRTDEVQNYPLVNSSYNTAPRNFVKQNSIVTAIKLKRQYSPICE